MTFREKLADLISGGALSHERRKSAELMKSSSDAWGMYDKSMNQNLRMANRLSSIAAQETPHANATVQRMARIARGEGE